MDRKLTIDDILEKEFKTKKIGGIDATDVDEFLNQIIEDYEYFEKSITELKGQLEQLRSENFKIKMNVLNSNSQKIDITQDVEIQKLSGNTNDLKVQNQIADHEATRNLNDFNPDEASLTNRIAALEDELQKIKEHTTKLN